MDDVTRVLFVCIGNICRSPTAEAVFRQRAEKAGWGKLFEADSAGISAIHAGEPPDRRAQAHAAERGYKLSHLRARQVSHVDFERFDLILCMERPVLDTVMQLRKFARTPRAETALFLDYFPGREGQDVPDIIFYPPDTTDFSPFLTRAKSLNPDIIHFWYNGDSTLTALPQALYGR